MNGLNYIPDPDAELDEALAKKLEHDPPAVFRVIVHRGPGLRSWLRGAGHVLEWEEIGEASKVAALVNSRSKPIALAVVVRWTGCEEWRVGP